MPYETQTRSRLELTTRRSLAVLKEIEAGML
jgi:hypothetical protein